MKQYLELMRLIRDKGGFKEDRTGTGTYAIFGHQMRFDLSGGQFPLVTTKKCHLKSIIHELLWFLQGDTNIQYLKDNSVRIWDEWCVRESEFGDSLEGRKLVYVEPRTGLNHGTYEPKMDADPQNEIHTRLRTTWQKMMDRCYNPNAHNHRFYGQVGVFVCARWHTFSNFAEDVQKLPNWKHKLSNWNGYNLDKDYYSSNYYSPDTCLWLSEMENGVYGSCSTLVAVTPDGHAEIYPSINKAAEELGIKRSTLHRFGARVPEILKGRNKVLKGWKFIILDEPFRYDFKKVGDLGPVYGAQWRNWGAGQIDAGAVSELVEQHVENMPRLAAGLMDLFRKRESNGIDQIAKLIEMIRNNPDSRRLMVSSWNPALVEQMALPPCHALFQFYVADGRLSCQLYQRKSNCALVA